MFFSWFFLVSLFCTTNQWTNQNSQSTCKHKEGICSLCSPCHHWGRRSSVHDRVCVWLGCFLLSDNLLWLCWRSYDKRSQVYFAMPLCILHFILFSFNLEFIDMFQELVLSQKHFITNLEQHKYLASQLLSGALPVSNRLRCKCKLAFILLASWWLESQKLFQGQKVTSFQLLLCVKLKKEMVCVVIFLKSSSFPF